MSATDSLLLEPLPDTPDFSIEAKLHAQGRKLVAGVDEAGRGPLAGPVVAAAVVLDPDAIPDGLNDSKQLSHKAREGLFSEILKTAHTAWASLPSSVIDQTNIRATALQAMTISVNRLSVIADTAIIDGRDVPQALGHIGTAYVKGDARSVSIAAASIVAKVIRDRIMIKAGENFPGYGFESHKGYGSQFHREAIEAHGPCPLHRRSFSPIRQWLEKNR
ncbi:MAG: ribonuclease HII [Pseudomonadota bacterium]